MVLVKIIEQNKLILCFHTKIKVFILYYVLLKMYLLELVKIARSKTVSHISDNSIFNNLNQHRPNASLVYVFGINNK